MAEVHGPRGLFEPSQLSPRTVVVACVTALGVLLAVAVAWRAPFALGLTIVAGLLAAALDHPVQWLERRGMKRALAITLVMLALVAVVAGLGFIVVPTAAAQARAFAEALPDAWHRVQAWPPYERFVSKSVAGRQLSPERVAQLGSQFAGRALAAVQGVLSVVVAGVTMFFVTIFMLFYGPALVRALLEETVPERRSRYERMLVRLHDALGGYIGGLGLLGGLNATFTSIFLAIERVPYFLPLGILSGLFSFIPVIGATLAGALLTVVAYATRGPWWAVATLAYYLVYQQVENHVFAPLIYKRTVQVNPLLAVVFVLFLTELEGLGGALVAVPLLAVVQIVVPELLQLRRSRLGLTPENGANVPEAARTTPREP